MLETIVGVSFGIFAAVGIIAILTHVMRFFNEVDRMAQEGFDDDR